jgi:ribonucleoside-diphosphate reductase alpha chain
MAIMRVDHPDVLEFMAAKNVEGKFSNFNFSIALTDEFMEAATLRPDSPWGCNWKGTPMKPRSIQRDGQGRLVRIDELDVTAGELLNRIVGHAWRNGEPGCVFIDSVNRTNPLPGLGPIHCCNLCGEQYLHDGDACNRGAVNLEKFAKAGKIDFEALREVTRTAVHFLDDVIDQTNFQVERVRRTFGGYRRIGLGIMGLADMLFLRGLPHDSEDDAVHFAIGDRSAARAWP